MRSRIGRRILAGYLAVTLVLALLLSALAYASVWIAQVAQRLDRSNRTAAQVLASWALAERRLFRLLQQSLRRSPDAEVESEVLARVLAAHLDRVVESSGLPPEPRRALASRLSATRAAYEAAVADFLAAGPRDRADRLATLLASHRRLGEILEGELDRFRGAAVAGGAQLEALQRATWLPAFLRDLARNSERANHLNRAVLATHEFETRFFERTAALLAASLDGSLPPPTRALEPDLALLADVERLAALPEARALSADLRNAARRADALLRPPLEPAAVAAVAAAVGQVVERLEALRPLLEVERDRALADLALVNESVVSFVETLSAASLFALLVGFLVVVAVTRAVTASLDALRDGMDRVRQGSLDVQVRVGRKDETADMAAVFNRMVAELRESRAKLQAYQQDLERIVEERTRALREAQAQLVQAEKLSAVGELVAGVAHELNNPLTSVLGYAQLLEGDPSIPEDLREYARVVVREADRARQIVQSLLTFARPQAVDREPVDVNAVVLQTLEVPRAEGEGVRIETRLHPEPLVVLGNALQLQQVFLNIVRNALQAMRGQGGRLEITTARAADRAVVEFADSGPGIAPEHLSRVFDPFFTTKKAGEGTGLGLSLSYGIVRDHGGTIHVRNRPEGGACFTVELPLAQPGHGETTT
jgi:signal transduction histidine kinase